MESNIAEEVDQIFPAMVPKNFNNEPESINYGMFAPLILEVVKRHDNEINQLSKNAFLWKDIILKK